jgi:predicted GIY-YIG superfamily endonuclease
MRKSSTIKHAASVKHSLSSDNGREGTYSQVGALLVFKGDGLMLAIESTHLCTWRGVTVALYPLRIQYFVYLIHFKTRYKHAGHYLGCSASIDARLLAHEQGRGSRLMEVVTQAGIEWELVRLWPCSSYEEMRVLERRLKSWHGSGALCPECNPHLDPDPLVMLRQGHYPFHLFDKPGKRRPMVKK